MNRSVFLENIIPTHCCSELVMSNCETLDIISFSRPQLLCLNVCVFDNGLYRVLLELVQCLLVNLLQSHIKESSTMHQTCVRSSEIRSLHQESNSRIVINGFASFVISCYVIL